MPDTVVVPTLKPEDLARLRTLTLQDVMQSLSPEKVNRKVIGFFNGHKKLHLREIPPEVRDDQHWLITIVAYAHHPQVSYGLEVVDGDAFGYGRVPDRAL